MKNNYSLNIEDSELQNIFKDSEGFRVRDRVFTIDEENYLYGFSTTSMTSGEIYHYSFNLSGTNDVVCSIFDDNAILLNSETVCKVYNTKSAVTHAVNYSQIVVNSPGWSTPLWGHIGSSLIPAEKVESINPDTPALSLFTGLVATFSNRTVWATANQVIINDPGLEPRTITAVNSIPVQGDVTDMFQIGGTGNFIIVTTSGITSIPPDGLSGFQFSGITSYSTHYIGKNSRNAATSRGTAYGLTRDGIMNLQSGELVPLTVYKRNRKLSEPVGPGWAGDYRIGTLWPIDSGYMVSFPDGNLCMIDLDYNTISWIVDDLELGIVGVAKSDFGRTSYWTTSGTWLTFYSNDPNLVGSVATELPTPGAASNLVRFITVTTEGDGAREVKSYVRGSEAEDIVPGVTGAAVRGISLWGEAVLYEVEYTSRRHSHGSQARTDGIYFELSLEGSGRKIQNASVEIRNQGPSRPTN